MQDLIIFHKGLKKKKRDSQLKNEFKIKGKDKIKGNDLTILSKIPFYIWKCSHSITNHNFSLSVNSVCGYIITHVDKYFI